MRGLSPIDRRNTGFLNLVVTKTGTFTDGLVLSCFVRKCPISSDTRYI